MQGFRVLAAVLLAPSSAQDLFLASYRQAGLKMDVPVYLYHSHLNADFALLRQAPLDSEVVDAFSYSLFDPEPVGYVSDGAFTDEDTASTEVKIFWSAKRRDVQSTEWSLDQLNAHGGDYVLFGSLGHIVSADVPHYAAGVPLTPLWNVFSDGRQDEIASPLNGADVNALIPGSPFRATGRKLGYVRQGSCARCNIGLSETFPSAGGADCIATCPAGTSSFNSIYHVGQGAMAASAGGRAFAASMLAAGQVAKSFDSSVDMQSGGRLHMSFSYMCCYTDADKATIRDVWKKTEWPAINITYGKPAWRIDNGAALPDHFSIITLLDEASNERVMKWVGEVEDSIRAAGVPVHIPRAKKEPFHSTLGVVNGSTFPMEQALAMINQIVPEGTWTGMAPIQLTKPTW